MVSEVPGTNSCCRRRSARRAMPTARAPPSIRTPSIRPTSPPRHRPCRRCGWRGRGCFVEPVEQGLVVEVRQRNEKSALDHRRDVGGAGRGTRPRLTPASASQKNGPVSEWIVIAHRAWKACCQLFIAGGRRSRRWSLEEVAEEHWSMVMQADHDRRDRQQHEGRGRRPAPTLCGSHGCRARADRSAWWRAPTAAVAFSRVVRARGRRAPRWNGSRNRRVVEDEKYIRNE